MKFLIIIIAISTLLILVEDKSYIKYFYKTYVLNVNKEKGIDAQDLVYRDGLGFQKSHPIPFTGEITGREFGYLKNGLWHGPYISYYDNGQIKYRGYYNKAKKNGLWQSFRKNSQIISKGNYKNGLKEGRWEFYHLFGNNMQARTNYKNGKKDGEHKSYWGNGNLRLRGSYKNGKPTGLWTYYNTDGIKEKKKKIY
jgi:antitoxin component YwqK of YwqJK toxin-antitoxin module